MYLPTIDVPHHCLPDYSSGSIPLAKQCYLVYSDNNRTTDYQNDLSGQALRLVKTPPFFVLLRLTPLPPLRNLELFLKRTGICRVGAKQNINSVCDSWARQITGE